MAGYRIIDLPAYTGSETGEERRKNLIEIVKNQGTFGSPVYGTDASEQIDFDELGASLVGTGLVRSVEHIALIVTAGIWTGDTYFNQAITLADRGRYFKFEFLSRAISHFWDLGFILQLPVSPPDGFCFLASFDGMTASKNDFDDFRFSNGCIYLCVWSASESKWLFSVFANHTDASINRIYIGNAIGGVQTQKQVFDTNNITYLYYNGLYLGAFKVILPPIEFNIGKKVRIALAEDYTSSSYQLEFEGDGSEKVLGYESINYKWPIGVKKGSTVSFEAIKGFDKVGEPVHKNYWQICEEKIII
jgi:hypothetical protein